MPSFVGDELACDALLKRCNASPDSDDALLTFAPYDAYDASRRALLLCCDASVLSPRSFGDVPEIYACALQHLFWQRVNAWPYLMRGFELPFYRLLYALQRSLDFSAWSRLVVGERVPYGAFLLWPLSAPSVLGFSASP